MNGPKNSVAFRDSRSFALSLAPIALIACGALIGGYAHADKPAASANQTAPSDSKIAKAPTLSKMADDREPLSAIKDPPASRHEAHGKKKPDQASAARGMTQSGEHFPDTPVGRALNKHLLILVDVSEGADERKERSLDELRKNAKASSQALLAAYHKAAPNDYFGRWLISLTLADLKTNEAYSGLTEIAKSDIPSGLKDNDLEGSALANESAIRQNAADGLAQLARAGNAAAEKDLLSLAAKPPSGDDAVRTVAIKGYLAAGRDADARIRAIKAQVPARYHDVATLTISPPEEKLELPSHAAIQLKKGGQ